MNLFENLQKLNEEYVQTVDDLFEDIANTIQERFDCDIDDTYYDVDNFPEEFKAQLVVYNVPHDIAETAKEMIEEKLSQYSNIKIDIYEDDKYCIGEIKNAYMIQISAFNDDIDF